MPVPIYAELSARTPMVLPPQIAAGGGSGYTADPCSVMLFHKAALTCWLSRPGIIRCGVWDAHPETRGTNETQQW